MKLWKLILEPYYGTIKAHPEAMEAHHGTKEAQAMKAHHGTML
jgi:hypothetical protein